MSSPAALLGLGHQKLARAVVGCAVVAHALLTGWLALARFAAVHNRTFDLALYTRTAWGLAHAEAWDPIVGGNFLGGHIPLVLAPLGWLGRLVGTVPVLIGAQSLTVAFAAWPISELAARRFGPAAGAVAAFGWLLYPNLAKVASYEFHPGTLAVLPFCFALAAFERERPRAFGGWCAAVVACRVSLALQVFVLGLLATFGPAKLRRTGRAVAISCALYFALSQFVLQPRFGQASSTAADLHFGVWGGSPFGVLPMLVRAPGVVLGHFAAPARLIYPLRVLAPFAFLPLLRARFLWVALPQLGLNLLSEFPTATELYSHYLTPALPALAFAALDGLERLRELASAPRSALRGGLAAWLAAALIANGLASGLPWARDFSRAEFSYDAQSASSRKVLGLIGPTASVQAPDALLPHLAERTLVCRAPPPERGTEFVVLDVTHRARFAEREDLLRTVEEPLVRTWLARPDHGLVFADARLLVLRRGLPPRSGLLRRYFLGFAPLGSAPALTDCLEARSAELRGERLALDFVARAACPRDLALRLGADNKPARVDLLFDGLLSPALLARSDLVRSMHVLSPAERTAIVQRGLRVGVLRSSGARPHPWDPVSVELPVRIVQ